MSARHIDAAPRSPASAERVEHLAVACLCAAALGLDLYFAGFYHLGFDETWHVFIAGVRPSAQFLRELRWESHPPLSYVILRWLVPLHGAELWPRLPSIVPVSAPSCWPTSQRASSAWGARLDSWSP